MPGKINLLRLLVFVLALATGAACFGAEPPKISVDLTKTLNERFDQRIQGSLKAPALANFTPFKPKQLGLCGGYRSRFVPLELFQIDCTIRSKNRLLDDPLDVLTAAFQGCVNLRILTLEASGPVTTNWAIILKDDLYAGFLILRKTETTDALAERLAYQLLSNAFQPEDDFDCLSDGTTDEEINDYKQSDFAPKIVFEFEGKNWLRIELDTKNLWALVRSKDKWAHYKFDQLSADAIVARVKDLHALYANQPAAN